MLLRLIQGIALLGLTVAIHAAVLGAMLHRFQKAIQIGPPPGFIATSWLLTRVAAVTVLAHLAEITIWAGFYYWKEALPSFETSFYFSSVTYATIGYGDIVVAAALARARRDGRTHRNPHVRMVRRVLLRGGQQALLAQARNRPGIARPAAPPCELNWIWRRTIMGPRSHSPRGRPSLIFLS